MPELIEVEIYRRHADRVVGRRIVAVDAPDAWFLKDVDADELRAALLDRVVSSTRRHGKLALIDLDDATVLGLRFGMTGRLIVDGVAALDDLEYGSTRDEPAWDRFGLHFDGGGTLIVRDPRRLGGVVLEPDTSKLGPDASGLTAELLAVALSGSTTALKARLLDQSRIAGLGNLCCDDALWRAGLSPLRTAGELRSEEVQLMADAIRSTVRELTDLGGSHMGALQPFRRVGGPCPLDGSALVRDSVGGRTTWWCRAHQT